MEQATNQLRDFLQYVALQFIANPKAAELRIGKPGDRKVNFRLILDQPDVAKLIGRRGFTASTIRNLMKSVTEREGIQANLIIHSHEEEEEWLARKGEQ